MFSCLPAVYCNFKSDVFGESNTPDQQPALYIMNINNLFLWNLERTNKKNKEIIDRKIHNNRNTITIISKLSIC